MKALIVSLFHKQSSITRHIESGR